MFYYIDNGKRLFTHRNIKYILIFFIFFNLVACSSPKTNKVPKINLPEMPLITQQIAEEIKAVCVPRKRCDNFNNWLNELYIFEVKYNIYRAELD